MRIPSEVHRKLSAKERERDQQTHLRIEALERRLAEVESARDAWQLLAIWSMAFALIVPTYKIWTIVGTIVLEMLK